MNKSPIQQMRETELCHYPRRNAFIVMQKRREWDVNGCRRWKVEGVAKLPTGECVEVECMGNVGNDDDTKTIVSMTHKGYCVYVTIESAKPTPTSMLRLAVAFAKRVAHEYEKPRPIRSRKKRPSSRQVSQGPRYPGGAA